MKSLLWPNLLTKISYMQVEEKEMQEEEEEAELKQKGAVQLVCLSSSYVSMCPTASLLCSKAGIP